MISSTNSEIAKTRILIVEDEGIIARDLSAMLEQMGYQVIGQAATYEEAIKLVSMLPTDLVLMDIKIRGARDGVETAEEIRRTVGLPVVFVTAHADTNTLKRANASQPFGYVVKPFNESALKVAIEVGLNRYRLQEESDSRRTWLTYAMEGISEAVLATDSQGGILLMNPGAEQLTGWSRDAALGRSLGEVLHLWDDGVELDLLQLWQDSTTNELLSYPSAVIESKNGDECAVVASFGPVLKLGGRGTYGYVALLRPASEASADAPIPSSSRHLEELAYALSNDLREPVRNVSCFASLLERSGRAQLDESSREYLSFIVEGSKRIESQMSALRSFHLAGSKHRNSGRFADATEICHEVLETLATKLAETGAVLEIDPLPAAAMDPEAFRTVVTQLLANSIRFRAERPLRIQISVARSGRFWTFCFGDNGRGFDSEQADRIFSLFTRAHAMPLSGNGVGLAICKRVVENAGGRIWAQSITGQGADIFVMLPALHSVKLPGA